MLKVSVSGIRGIWGDSLTHEVLSDYLKSFVALLGKKKKVAVGSDTRPTRNIIRNLTFSILESYGYEIIDLGILPTPLVLFAVKEMNLDGGIVISSSHNPIEWNAFKLVKKGGFFLNQPEMDEIQEIYSRKKFLPYHYQDIGKIVSHHESIIKDYIEKARTLVDFNTIRQAEFKVVVDGVNGTINTVIYPFLHFVDIQPKIIFQDINRDFERGAEPLPENLSELSKKVVEYKADIGLAYDPDADRLALVDETGKPVGEDWTLSIAYLNLLEKNPSDIVVNYSTSMMTEVIAAQAGKKVHYAKVGEINVTEKMIANKIFFGGEGNGGVIYPKINNCRDSLIATLMVLEYLARKKKKLSEIVMDFPRIFNIKTKIPVSGKLTLSQIEEKLVHFLEKNNLKIKNLNKEDGVRIDYESGWIQARASNTEPIVRIMGENQNIDFHKEILEYISHDISALA